jgi:hypothetical protein
MKRVKSSLAAIALVAALAQAAASLPTAAAGQALALTSPAPLAKDNAALPRIAAPTTPAVTKVNAALA